MNPIEFGKFIKGLRKGIGLTLNELSKASTVSQPYLSHIENGKRGIPQPDTLKKLAEPLGVSYEDLLHKAGHLDVKPLNFFGFKADSPEKYEELIKMISENTPNDQIIGTPEYNAKIENYLKGSHIAFGNRQLDKDDREMILSLLKWRYPDYDKGTQP